MPKKYKELNKDLITLGGHIPFDVFIYLDEEQSPLLFNKGTVIEPNDLAKLQQHPNGRLIILRDDYEAFVQNGEIKSDYEDD